MTQKNSEVVVTSLGAALLNGSAGLLIAWVLVRSDFRYSHFESE